MMIQCKKDKMMSVDAVLPDSLLSRHACAVGSIEQFWLCVTLILFQEKPTVVHRENLSTNHASSQLSSSQYFGHNVKLN